MSKTEEGAGALYQLNDSDDFSGPLLRAVTKGEVPAGGEGIVVMYMWSDWVESSVAFKPAMEALAQELVKAHGDSLLGGMCYACCPMATWDKGNMHGDFVVRTSAALHL